MLPSPDIAESYLFDDFLLVFLSDVKVFVFFASKKNINKANIFFQSRIVKLLSILIMAENIAEKNMETVLFIMAE